MSLASLVAALADRVADEFNTVRDEIAALPTGGGGGFDPVKKVQFFALAIPGNTLISNVGTNMLATGSFTASDWSTSQYGGVPKVEISASTSTSAVAGIRGIVGGSFAPHVWRGNAAGRGGFNVQLRFGPGTGQTVAGRMFAGIAAASSAPTDVEPSTLIDMIGVGFDAADTQLYVMHNDSSGTATKVATGLTRSNTNRSKMYLLTLEAAANGSDIDVTVEDIFAGTSFTTTASTNLPSSSNALGVRGYCSVGGVSSSISFAFSSLYVESGI